jgi:hypothetical protein
VAALVQDQGKDVATCVWAGYEQALSRHHPWLTRKLVKARCLPRIPSRDTARDRPRLTAPAPALVQAGVAAAPSRAAFLAALGVPSAAAEQQLRALLAHFSPALRCAVALLVERGVENAY